MTPDQTVNNMARTFILIVLVTTFSCKQKTQKDLGAESIIPKPAIIEATGSSFVLNEETTINFPEGSDKLGEISDYLAGILRKSTGLPIVVQSTVSSPGNNTINFAFSEGTSIQEEGYKLEINEEYISLTSASPVGIFRGVQTIRQLLPAGIESSSARQGPWEIATGTIEDYPAYSFRGSMLDVSRHFFDVETVKKYIDFLACYKLNILHLHLTDDQGWRIEIKSWPNLTTHGGKTEVGGGEGGFYTQEQYTEIVDYAADRYITIIPEIDMPGHTNAALASYPQLNCDGKARDLYTGTEVGFSTLCTNKEITYQFIDDVIREIAALTPGPYIHIGGDESHSTKKEDYIPFIERVQGIVNAHGKRMIGWDETAQTSLVEGTVVQLWHNADFAREAVSKGSQLIMSPATRAYLDMQYDSTTRLGLHWAAYIEVDDGYNWDPASMIEGIGRENILGIEAPLWSETVTNLDDIEYLAFPRLPGYAEIGWTADTARSWEEYRNRLAKHGERFEVMEIDYYPSSRVSWANKNSAKSD